MSQFWVNNNGSGPLPPIVATEYILNLNSPAIPSANQLNVIGGFSGLNYANGIYTDNNTPGDPFIYINLSNRFYGEVLTIGNIDSILIAMDLTVALGASVAGTVKIHFEVAAYEETTPAGLGYAIEASVRTDGTTAFVISTPDGDEDEDPALQDEADWNVTTSGNSVILEVTGVTGLTLNWTGIGTYLHARIQ